jgi:hypothetical protein
MDKGAAPIAIPDFFPFAVNNELSFD